VVTTGRGVALAQRLRWVRCLREPGLRWLIPPTAAFAIGYLAQLVTPSRLNTNSIRYHDMAIGLQEGVGLYGYGEKQFPPLFSVVLACIEQLMLATSGVFVAFKLMCLAIGLFFAATLLSTPPPANPRVIFAILFLTVASWVVIKHVTLSLTDIQYFAVSMAALWALEQSRTESGLAFCKRIALATLLTGVGIAVRTHGIAMIPPLVLPVVSRAPVTRLAGRCRSFTSSALLMVLIAAISTAPFISGTDYFASAPTFL